MLWCYVKMFVDIITRLVTGRLTVGGGLQGLAIRFAKSDYNCIPSGNLRTLVSAATDCNCR